jgi:hypothetical protein
MTGRSGTTAGELVAQARRELVETAEAIRSHRFLERLRVREIFLSSRPARCSIAQSLFRVRVGEGLDQLGVDPLRLHVRQVIGGTACAGCSAATRLVVDHVVHRGGQCHRAVDGDRQPVGDVQSRSAMTVRTWSRLIEHAVALMSGPGDCGTTRRPS